MTTEQAMIRLDKTPLSRIRVMQSASELTWYAAHELQKYILLCTGVKLPVVRGDDASGCGEFLLQLVPDGYATQLHDRIRVSADGNSLRLCGENEISVLYAVYDFLQEFCGVRFFAPGAEFEHVPRMSELVVELSRLPYENGSAFAIRDFVNRTNSHDVFSFAVKNRVNTILGCGPWVNGSEKCSDVNAALIHSFGLKVRGPGHSWKHFVPQAELFAEHPEYFPLLKGKRTVTGRTACFSNPEVQRIFRENLRRYLRRHPYWDIFAFWAEDVPDMHYCECDECRRLETSDWYFTLVNMAAEVVAEELPNATFELIAYEDTTKPPQTVRSLFRNGRNMLVNCCINKNRDLYRPYAQRTFNNDMLMDLFGGWLSWAKETGYEGRLMMMEYYNLCEYPGACGRTFLWPLAVMQEDAKFYLRSGITAMGAFTGFDRLAFPTPLNLWAWLKIWNNPELDLEALKKDFHNCYFGLNAPRIMLYFNKLQELMMKPASAESISAIEALATFIHPENGFREELLLCHLRYAVIVKRLYLAYYEDDRERFEAVKREFLSFPAENSRILSRAVAPFPLLWYDYLFYCLYWREDGTRNELPLKLKGMFI